MREQPDYTEQFRGALESADAELNDIETRRCSSDDYEGVEYKFYGHYVPIKPIITVVADLDGFAIESMSHSGTVTKDMHPNLTVFIADLREPEQSHPAFV